MGIASLDGAFRPYVEIVPDYEIRDGIMHIMAGGACVCCMPVRTFQMGMAKASLVIAAYERRHFPREEERPSICH